MRLLGGFSPRVATGVGGEAGDDQSHDRVGPRPTERGVEAQPDENVHRQGVGQPRLLGLRDEHVVPKRSPGAPLCDCDRQHHRERDDVECDPDGRRFDIGTGGEFAHRFDGDVGRQEEEGDGERPQRRALPSVCTAASCQSTTEAANTSMLESIPKPTRAIEPAASPAVTATPPSMTSQTTMSTAKRTPRRRNVSVSRLGAAVRIV